MRHRARTTITLTFALLTLGPPAVTAKEPATAPTAAPVASPAPSRPATWAQPLAVPGVPNLLRVSSNFYRSAQPEAVGFKALAKNPGIKTVVSLRAYHSDRPLVAGTGITPIRIRINTWHIETEDVVRALATIRRAETQGPVLLHCQHGADRTGLITALYRVLYQGWSKDAARTEMTQGAFGYHAIWGNIPRYLRNADVEALRKMVKTFKP